VGGLVVMARYEGRRSEVKRKALELNRPVCIQGIETCTDVTCSRNVFQYPRSASASDTM